MNKDFFIKTEKFSEKDRLYLVGLLFLLGYHHHYVHVPVCYESIKNAKYVFFEAIEETYHIWSTKTDETWLCDPKNNRIMVTLTWEEYPIDQYKPIEKWTPKYEVRTLAQIEEKCDFLSKFSKEQIMYIGSRVPSITVKTNESCAVKYRNPYKLVDRDYNFCYHPGDGEDAL